MKPVSSKASRTMWYLKTHVAGVLAKLELRDRAAMPKAWDICGIDDPLTHAADRDNAGQMPYGLMSADRP